MVDGNQEFGVRYSNRTIFVAGFSAKFGEAIENVYGGVVRRIKGNRKLVVTITGLINVNPQYLEFLEYQNNPSLPNVVVHIAIEADIEILLSPLGVRSIAYEFDQDQLKFLAYHATLALRDIHAAGFIHGSIAPETT